MNHLVNPSKQTPKDLTMTAREYHFGFIEAMAKNRYWHGDNPVATHFFNALQATFPEGERFFIDSARDAVESIGEENLAPLFRQQIKTFVRQEAIHGRQHEIWGQALVGIGYAEVEEQSEQLKQFRLWTRKNIPAAMRIAITAGGEHYTASLAHYFLYKRPDFVDNADAPFKQALMYHALEEIEHKAVCFDLFNAVSGSYWLRITGLLMAAFDIMRLTRKRHIYFLKKDGLWNWKTRWEAWRFVWGFKGLATALIPYSLRYLRPGFHPWQTDERQKFYERYGAQLSELEMAG